MLQIDFKGPGNTFRLFDFKISGTIFGHIFFLNDLHILQTTCTTNKNITKTTIRKTKQHKHWTLSAIIKSYKVIETKGIQKFILIYQPQIYTKLIWNGVWQFIHIFERLWKQINKQKNKQKIQVHAIFSYISEPLYLSDFMMNLIDFNILQFCWKLNLLLP